MLLRTMDPMGASNGSYDTHREKSIIDKVLETKERISNILRKELIIVHIRQACNLEYLTLRVLV